MRKLLISLLLIFAAAFSALAQSTEPTFDTDAERQFSDQYLDSLNRNKSKRILNDYTMIGVQGGAGMSMVWWNPTKSQQMRFSPYNFGVLYTRYGKMFGYMSYFGFQGGVFFGEEGYKFKADKETGQSPTLEGATEASFQVIEVPIMAQIHVDFWKMKMMLNVGCYGGYRFSIERYGEYVTEDKKTSFMPYDHRFDYGIKGGVGFGFVFDPIEIHIQAMYKHSLSSLYDPDYYSQYYYRYAYPANIVISAGVHFQLTKRVGKTRKMLKDEAKALLSQE